MAKKGNKVAVARGKGGGSMGGSMGRSMEYTRGYKRRERERWQKEQEYYESMCGPVTVRYVEPRGK